MRGDIYDKEGDPDSHMARILLLRKDLVTLMRERLS